MNLQDIDVSDRQVWLRAFYGFDPEGAGYLGFTYESQRRSMMDEMRDGDLVLIYGAVEDLTDKDLRAQALGFLEIDLEPCRDSERMSVESHTWKVERGFQKRWNYGIKVRRAWRVRNRVRVATIAPKAYEGRHRFTRTTTAILLESDERERALSHPVYQVNVFGEPEIDVAEQGPIGSLLKPSRGIPPSHGQRTSNYEDSETSIYLMILTENAHAFLTKGAAEFGHALAKVGRTNDIARRLKEVNCGFPERAMFRWKPIAQHRFATAGEAESAEEDLKYLFDRDFKSQGNEFFSGDRKAMAAAFDRFCARKVPIILGAAGKAKGIK